MKLGIIERKFYNNYLKGFPMPTNTRSIYSPYFTEQERRDLEAVPHDDLSGEIYLLRYLLVLVRSESPPVPYKVGNARASGQDKHLSVPILCFFQEGYSFLKKLFFLSYYQKSRFFEHISGGLIVPPSFRTSAQSDTRIVHPGT